MTKLLFIGHGSFRLTANDGAVIYIDPFFEGDYSAMGDLILITHEHYDHNKTELVKLNSGGVIMRAKDFLPHYSPFAFGDIDVTAVSAYNKNHSKGCVGYVVSIDGKRLYFAGDTSKTDHMAKMKGIDYAFLPIDGVFNMDATEATECAELIGARFCVPVHTAPPEDEYNQSAVNNFVPYNKRVVLPGREITL